MNKINFCEVVDAIMDSEDRSVIKATKYLSPKLIVRATRKMYGKRLPAKNQNTEITLTIGRPNYAEREMINTLLEIGEPFPVKKIQFKLYNPKRNAPRKDKRKV